MLEERWPRGLSVRRRWMKKRWPTRSLRVLQKSLNGGTAMGEPPAPGRCRRRAARNADDLIHIYETILREVHK